MKNMKFASILLLICFLGLVSVYADEEACTSKGTAALRPSYIIPDTPVNILYVIITMNADGWTYNNDMYLGYKLLLDAVQGLNNTSTVDLHWLYQGNRLNKDLNQYSQIWVVDLCSKEDKENHKMQAYQAIADWWQSKDQPHIICDGRWISSLWTYAGTKGAASPIYGYPVNHGRPNGKLVANYMYNLLIRGGGLVLATDHDAFVSGINEINRLIGLRPFTDIYYEFPYLLEVDDQSNVLQWPYDPTHHWREVNGKKLKYLWDDSSTGFAPYNQQPNGLILYPLGWHGSRDGTPGISTTIRGNKGFLIAINSPACDAQFLAGASITFSASVVTEGTAPYTWSWSSDLDGALGTSDSFTKSLSVGVHQVTVKALDSQKLAAEAKVRITVGVTPGTNPVCYLVRYNDDPVAHEIFPIKRNRTASAYFSYNNPVKGSTNTPDNLEEAFNAQFFFYDDGTTSSAFHLFGAKNGQSKAASLKLRVSGSVVSASKLTLSNLEGNSDFGVQGSVGSGSIQYSKSSSGFVFTGLPRDSFYCLHYSLSQTSNAKQLVVRSHSADSTTIPNNNPIIAWRNKAGAIQSLDLCRSQCRCSNLQTLTKLADTFTSSIVLDPFSGAKANYFPGSQCSWLIQPASPTGDDIWGTVLYFESMSLGNGDSVSVYAGTDDSGQALGTFTGNTAPAPIRVDSNSPIFVKFSADNDASTGQGFTASYAVIPQLNSVTPNNGASKAKTPVTVTGANFYSSSGLSCQFDKTVVNAKFLDSKHIACVAPVHTSGTYQFEVSNDGSAFTVTWGNNPPHPVVGFTWRGYNCDD